MPITTIDLGTKRHNAAGEVVKTFTLAYEVDRDGQTIKVVRHLPAEGIERIGKHIARWADQDTVWNVAVMDGEEDVTFDFTCFQGSPAPTVTRSFDMTCDDFADDILRRARWALTHNDGHPVRVWSTREQLAAALVLKDKAHLEAMGFTIQEAHRHVYDGMASPSKPDEWNGWLQAIRDRL